MKTNVVLFVLLLISTSVFDANARVEIYKWVDSKGVLHYSEKPPKQGDYVHIERFTNKNRFKADVTVFNKEKKRSDLCLRAQQNDQLLRTQNNIRKHNKHGELVLLSELELTEQRALATQQIKRYCKE
ncbi:DUF4124 domain-containing protein [Flocculibacter collagenilyticus]|uniref:DUF4124 domain-containing protein n=1 Tax=Flocculibacter collagenilyticus TaxID=2744479 RepID=UPI0018F638BE|nr:DUF4124 domain-containing protein [Flocculibacter collagenilyticus]